MSPQRNRPPARHAARPAARPAAAKPAAPPPPQRPPAATPASNRTVARRAAQQTGQRAEWMAAWLLRFTGFRILARNYRTPVGEVDLIARRGRLLIFVEVKARATDEAAAMSVSMRQRDRICRAAEVFLVARPELGDCAVRFDAVVCAPGRFPRHIKDTWREPAIP
jgi:putative endonuclease